MNCDKFTSPSSSKHVNSICTLAGTNLLSLRSSSFAFILSKAAPTSTMPMFCPSTSNTVSWNDAACAWANKSQHSATGFINNSFNAIGLLFNDREYDFRRSNISIRWPTAAGNEFCCMPVTAGTQRSYRNLSRIQLEQCICDSMNILLRLHFVHQWVGSQSQCVPSY